MPPERTAVDAASYRDPDTSVFYADGRVLRGLSPAAARTWDAVAASDFFGRLVDEGRVVRTTSYDGPAPPSPRREPWARVVEHERVPFVSYPYEWPFAMLRDAALCQLDVLLAALDDSFSLKDGTSYNVQFVGARPTFIDIGSFEPASGPWPGYRQFCQTALFPLLVQAHLGVPYQAMLRGRVDGLNPGDVAPLFAGRRKWRRGVLRNVVLHAYADRRSTTDSQKTAGQLRAAGFDVDLAKATARKLRTLVSRLDVRPRATAWSDYRDTCSYTEADAEAKRSFVRAVAEDRPGGTVLDLGANDGVYARLVADVADYVVAVDADEQVIDRLYRSLRADGVDNVLPLVVDLTDPSPGLGWRNQERRSFAERVDADLVLGLALVHHLVIGANVPLPAVVDWLASFDARVVVEFVDRDDPMAGRLLAQKPAGLFDDYRLEAFERLLQERFAVLDRAPLPSGTRTLFLTEPR